MGGDFHEDVVGCDWCIGEERFLWLAFGGGKGRSFFGLLLDLVCVFCVVVV